MDATQAGEYQVPALLDADPMMGLKWYEWPVAWPVVLVGFLYGFVRTLWRRR